MYSCAGTTRNSCSSKSIGICNNVYFYCWITTAIKDLSGKNFGYVTHLIDLILVIEVEEYSSILAALCLFLQAVNERNTSSRLWFSLCKETMLRLCCKD